MDVENTLGHDFSEYTIVAHVLTVGCAAMASGRLHPGASLVPALRDSADGVVTRQIACTVADTTSRVVYGIRAVVTREVSRREGHDEAVTADVTMLRGGTTEVATPGRA